MYNNVTSRVFNDLCKSGISSLRFNFRGVGKSTGPNSGIEGELEDVRTCLNYLITKSYDKILICGYSYGAAIGCSNVNYSNEIIGFCAISFPWDFMGDRFKEMTQTNKPKLFIQGTNDNIAPFQNFSLHYSSYSEPKSRVFIEGADHFYGGFESIVSNEILKFVKVQFGITS